MPAAPYPSAVSRVTAWRWPQPRQFCRRTALLSNSGRFSRGKVVNGAYKRLEVHGQWGLALGRAPSRGAPQCSLRFQERIGWPAQRWTNSCEKVAQFATKPEDRFRMERIDGFSSPAPAAEILSPPLSLGYLLVFLPLTFFRRKRRGALVEGENLERERLFSFRILRLLLDPTLQF